MEPYTYLLINILSVSVPFVASFHPYLRFYREWKYLFPAMGITLLFFISWDVLFTHLGVWGFNPRYLTGINLINLPIEEWMFFIAIPYASLFTHFALGKIMKFTISANLHLNQLYTSVTFIITGLFLVLHNLFAKRHPIGQFYLSYVVILIPFFIVNGILTGSFIPEEVVWYNNSLNLGIRLGTIPIEDAVYGFLMLAMSQTFYTYFKARSKSSASKQD
jgi:lycopene cyclase domain-containing protein